MAALSSGGAWLVLLAVLGMLASAGCVALVLLTKVLASEREVRIRVQVIPWPRIEIDAKANVQSGH
jgi:hypothetical protein